MDSTYSLHYSRFFLHQWERYDQNTRDFLQDKFALIKQDPFRFPTHRGYSRIRKIKLSREGKYQRLMFSIHRPEPNDILILGIFPRDDDYQEFERKFGELKK